ncbi:hypothetical protein ETB97_000998 [Aspergillus alliaceus]|uniref:RCHY1 zinc-ribbon domain-containing protein n=1 Tax=Petromyces alliaceus TaxID=209559 RepID=A0A8H6A2W7_PETAA|nr:hypothetical protein ETB97_000998 [Aspergillus burnettii]
MSGLITSLLIESVVRQARRLSQQTEGSRPPSILDQPEPLSIQYPKSSAGNEDNTNSTTRAMMSHSGQEEQPNTGLPGGYVASEDDPSFSALTESTDETEPLSLQHQTRHIVDNIDSEDSNSHIVVMHGIDPMGPRQAASVTIPTRSVSQQTSTILPETERASHNHLGIVEANGHFSLPEDDGMGDLRKKIHAIRDLNCSNMEQARMIHRLMTENYNACQSNLDTQTMQATLSHSGPRSPDRPVTPNRHESGQSFKRQSLIPASPSSVAQQEVQHCLTAEDLKPTFFPKNELEPPLDDVDDTDAEELEEACLGCRHYKRNVKLQCHACKSKTITNMESTFRNLDRTIQGQPMPAEFNDTKALIYCNDCGAKSVVKYHWLGLKCDMCESYNTAQIRLVNGDILDSLEDGDDDVRGGFVTTRTRPSSQGADEIVLPTLASLRLDTDPGPGTSLTTRLNAPLSAESNGRFSSYSITRGRAVSPVISNYFGIPPDRDSERPKSTSLFGGGASKANENEDSGEIRLWGTKFKYRLEEEDGRGNA